MGERTVANVHVGGRGLRQPDGVRQLQSLPQPVHQRRLLPVGAQFDHVARHGHRHFRSARSHGPRPRSGAHWSPSNGFSGLISWLHTGQQPLRKISKLHLESEILFLCRESDNRSHSLTMDSAAIKNYVLSFFTRSFKQCGSTFVSLIDSLVIDRVNLKLISPANFPTQGNAKMVLLKRKPWAAYFLKRIFKTRTSWW